MFDIGGWEFLIIVVVAILIIGPKDLPGMIRSVAGWVRRARELASEFQSGIDDLAQEVELEKISEEFRHEVGLEGANNIGDKIREEIGQSIDPSGELFEDYGNTKETILDDLEIVQKEIKHQNHSPDPKKPNATSLREHPKKSSGNDV
jgi:sec-independent protein translocase protein TatB